MKKPVIGVLGATGVVGRHILEILDENTNLEQRIGELESEIAKIKSDVENSSNIVEKLKIEL